MKLNAPSLIFHAVVSLLVIAETVAAWHFASWVLGADRREISHIWIFEQVGIMTLCLLGFAVALNLLTSIPRMRQKKAFWAHKGKGWPR